MPCSRGFSISALAEPSSLRACASIVQLLLVGLVLKTVFALASPLLIAAVALAMFAMASYEIGSRQERRFAGAWGYGIGAGTTMLATLLVTAFALLGTLRPVPWYAPQVLIPLLGIILGNVMNGVSVSLNALSTSITRERPAIEGRLALGTDCYTALKPLQRSALRSGMIPIINQMSAAGVITLPGMMTGQILAGMIAWRRPIRSSSCFCSPAAPGWGRWRRSTSPLGKSPTNATVCGSIGWRSGKMARASRQPSS